MAAVAAALVLGSLGAPAAAYAHPADASASAPKCFGKKPSIVVTAKNKTVTLSKKNKNTVIDLLGKGDSVNAGKAKGYTYVCDTGGAKKITTGDGNDKVSIKNGNTTVSTGKGNDTFIQTGTGNPTVHLGAGNDTATLAKGNGVLYGDDGNDSLKAGSSGKQKLYGGNGSDTLFAGKATSTLDGQGGPDDYVVSASQAKNTTYVIAAGDMVNGKAPVTTTPPPPPASGPSVAGTVVTFTAAADPTLTVTQEDIAFALTGVSTAGHAVTRWSFDYGDGSPVTGGVGRPPAMLDHAYTTAGLRTATLTLTDETGRAYPFTAALNVASAPVGMLGAPTLSGSTATLANTSTVGAGDSATMWAVDYGDLTDGDGGTGAGPASFSHTYAQPGTYQVTYLYATTFGGLGIGQRTVTVSDSSPHISLLAQPGNAETLAALPANLTAGGSIDFDLSRSVAATGHVLQSNRYMVTATHTNSATEETDGSDSSDLGLSLPDPGTWTITASVESDDNTVTTTTGTVVVASAPAAAPTVTPSATTVAVGQPVTFTTAATPGTAPAGGAPDTVTAQTLVFGDGTTAAPSGATTTHTFSQPGDYNVYYGTVDSYFDAQAAYAEVTVSAATPTLQVQDDEGLGALADGSPSPWVGVSVPAGTGVNDYAGVVTGIGGTGVALGSTVTVNYGDGSNPVTTTLASGPNVDFGHEYPTAGGEYVATFTLTDRAGRTVAYSQHVSVAGATTVAAGTTVSNPDAITFNNFVGSPGAGAVTQTWAVTVSDTAGGAWYASGNGPLPASVSVPTPGAVGQRSYAVSQSSDHDGYNEVDGSVF